MAFALRKTTQPAASTPAAAEDQLPAPVQEFLVQFCAPSAADPLADVPVDRLAKAMERRKFVLAVYHHPLPAESACDLIAAKHKTEYPVLAVGGKRNTSALTYANYRRWLAKLGKTKRGSVDVDNLAALVDGYKGRVAEPVHPEFARIFCRLYLSRERRDVSVCWRFACQQWRAQIRPEPAPPYKRIVRLAAELRAKQPNAVLLAREGEDALRNKNGDYVDRSWRDYTAGQVLIGDHRVHDFLCKVLDKDDNWRAVRPWISAWHCPVSGALVAITVCDSQPNGDVIEYTLCNAIRRLGNQPPDYIYVDNGADFLRQGFVTPIVAGGVEHSICKSLGITPKIALPYNARVKTVERCFTEVSREFDRCMPAYVGNMTQWRDSAKVNAFYKDASPLPTIGQVQQALDYWIEQMFHERPRPRAKGSKLAPAQALAERPPRPSLPDDVLAQRFARPVGIRSVGRGGRISLDGVVYQTPELWDRIGVDERKVLVCKTSWVDDCIVLRELDGRHVCQAPRLRELDAIEADRTGLAAKMRAGRALESQARRAIADLTGQTRAERRADAAPIEQIADGAVRLVSAQTPALPKPPEAAKNADPEMAALVATLDELNLSRPHQPTAADDIDDLLAQLAKDDQ